MSSTPSTPGDPDHQRPPPRPAPGGPRVGHHPVKEASGLGRSQPRAQLSAGPAPRSPEPDRAPPSSSGCRERCVGFRGSDTFTHGGGACRPARGMAPFTEPPPRWAPEVSTPRRSSPAQAPRTPPSCLRPRGRPFPRGTRRGPGRRAADAPVAPAGPAGPGVPRPASPGGWGAGRRAVGAAPPARPPGLTWMLKSAG